MPAYECFATPVNSAGTSTAPSSIVTVWVGQTDPGGYSIFIPDQNGDGLVNALQILQACVRTGRSLSQWLLPVQLYPQALLNVHWSPDRDWRSNALLARVQAQVEAELGSTGRVLVRHSGTEPLLHVMVEAQDGDQASRCAERLVTAARDG